MCDECGMYGIGQLEEETQMQILLGGVGGAVVAKMVDPYLDSVKFLKENNNIKQGVKIGAGGALYYMAENPLIQGAGLGIVTEGAVNILTPILAGFMKSGGEEETVSGTPQKRQINTRNMQVSGAGQPSNINTRNWQVNGMKKQTEQVHVYVD